MGYVRITDRPEELFHYTRRDNLASILRDGRIKRMGDAECWFCSTLDDTLELMRATVIRSPLRCVRPTKIGTKI